VKRLLIQPVPVSEYNDLTCSNSVTANKTDCLLNNTVIDNTVIENASIDKAVIDNTVINNTVSNDRILNDNISSCSNSVKKLSNCCDTNDQSSGSLQPLAGIYLPRTVKQWEEMNAYFHSSSLFRYAGGKIIDLDRATAEFNTAIYGYLRDRHGTLSDKKNLRIEGWGAMRLWTKNINHGLEAV